MTEVLTGQPARAGPTQHTRRTVLLSSLLGTTIEWYDFFLYSTAASLVFDRLFFPGTDASVATFLSFATFFVGFLARPFGAVLFGHIGDRLGRKSTLVITMLVMGAATALIGVLPTYSQAGALAPVLLVSLRIVQGLAVGGEWAGAVLLAVEHAPRKRFGWYGSWPQVGLALGLALGTGLFALLGQVMDDEAFLRYGWRVAFVLSIALVITGLVVRLRVAETPVFRHQLGESGAVRVPIVAVFTDRAARRNLVLGMFARWADGASFNTWAVFAISYTTVTLGMDRVSVLAGVTVAALVMASLIPVAGRAVDRWGSRQVYLVGVVLFGCTVIPAFAGFQTRDPLVVGGVLVLSLGIAYAVSYAAEGTLFAHLFPARVRYTGMSFVYQFSGIYSAGVTPMLVTALITFGGGGAGWACAYLIATAVVSVVATFALRSRDLHVPNETPGVTAV